MDRSPSGFTLIELLIVLGIIAVLTGILLAVTRGGGESARAAKCLANMRSLAQAVNSWAMESHDYPFAGSIQCPDVDGNKFVYKEQRGWISWLSNSGDPFGYQSGKAPTSPAQVSICKYDETNIDNARFAITNGTVWQSVGRNMSVYTCPTHVIYCKNHKLAAPNWSYVMNARFGYDYTKGSKGLGTLPIDYGTLERADRVLLFAELPVLDPLTGESVAGQGDEWQKDCTLQYKATVGGSTYGKQWGGTAESIGFVHKTNKGRRCAHVAFADGHVEKIMNPKDGSGGGLTMEQLTALLCAGKDYAFDGSKFLEVKDTD